MSTHANHRTRLPYRKALGRAQSFLRSIREAYKEGQRLRLEAYHQNPFLGL